MNDFKEIFSLWDAFKRGALSAAPLLFAITRRFAWASEERLRSLKPLVNLMFVMMAPDAVSLLCC